MMGAFGHKISLRPIRNPAVAILLALALNLSVAGGAIAEGPSDPQTPHEPAVSTSPSADPGAPLEALKQTTPRADRRPALTRAATRQRVESMTPLPWLAAYGSVEIGRIVAPASPAP